MRARPIPRDGARAIISAFDPPAVHRKLSSCRPDAPRDKLPKGTDPAPIARTVFLRCSGLCTMH